MTGVSIVIPTVGRPSLADLLARLPARTPAGRPVEVLVVRDTARAGPAAARNEGWHRARHSWVVFLDDDVLPDEDWAAALDRDLDAPPWVGGVQGRLRVPPPTGRRPTDWERSTAGLARGRWLTADMAYRRVALSTVDGFDERFGRAYREDAELAYRVRRAGWQLTRGQRTVTHPVRPESRWVSVRTQRGNADDALLHRLYGRDWRTLVDVPPGRRGRHTVITVAGCTALVGAALRRPLLAALGGTVWALGTAEFAAARIAPGPRDRREVTTMLVTSAVIPPLACFWWLYGRFSHGRDRGSVYFSPPWEDPGSGGSEDVRHGAPAV